MTLFYQTFVWLAFGHWPSIELHDLLAGLVRSEWITSNEILLWLGRQSVGVVGVLLGYVLARGGSHMLERHRDLTIGQIH
jgi:hypothetical protein